MENAQVLKGLHADARRRGIVWNALHTDGKVAYLRPAFCGRRSAAKAMHWVQVEKTAWMDGEERQSRETEEGSSFNSDAKRYQRIVHG